AQLHLGYNDATHGGDMQLRRMLAALVVIVCPLLTAQQMALSKTVLNFVRVNGSRTVLEHVRVIDGTGAPAIDDRNVIIENGKIATISAGADVAASAGTTVLDLRGYSVFPGIVGMHNHLFYVAVPNTRVDGPGEPLFLVPQMTFSAPRLYLAG